MEDIRNAAVKNLGLKAAFADSMQCPLCLLTEVTNRLKFKDKPVVVGSPCIEEEINELWEKVREIDPSVQIGLQTLVN